MASDFSGRSVSSKLKHPTTHKKNPLVAIKVSGNKTDCFLWYQLLKYYHWKCLPNHWVRWIVTHLPPPPHPQPNKRTFHWYLNGEESTVIHIWRRLLIGNRGKNSNHKYDRITFPFVILHYRLDILKFNFILSLTFSR